MTYKVIVYGFDSGLNELLHGRIYDYRTKKYRNPEKNRNDNLCVKHIKQQMKNVVIEYPITIGYRFFCKDKRHDRMNVASAFVKSFEDALQKCGVIDNDGWDDVLTPVFEFYIDKDNPRIEVYIKEERGI